MFDVHAARARRWMHRTVSGTLACVAVAATLLTAAPASADAHSNTQTRLPSNLYFADVNGDS